MSHFDDAKDLVKHANQALPKLEQEYQSSLNEQKIEATLLIDIKNLMENLRSALDFSAHGLFANYCQLPKTTPRIYFPYARLDEDLTAFRAANQIERNIPGITAARSDVVARLESYQHFAGPANRWLPVFMKLNNENKHEKLTPQRRKEARQLQIESRGTGIVLGPGAGISLGAGASISFGDVVIPGGQDFNGERPATIYGQGTQTVTVWVSFTFDSNGEDVLPFLKNAVAQVDRIVNELAAL
jgi:hypothetical protein